MKNILLATTALVMTAGAASAEITWTGSVTAGIARIGSVDAVAANAANMSDAQIIAYLNQFSTSATNSTANALTNLTLTGTQGSYTATTANKAAIATYRKLSTSAAALTTAAAAVSYATQTTSLSSISADDVAVVALQAAYDALSTANVVPVLTITTMAHIAAANLSVAAIPALEAARTATAALIVTYKSTAATASVNLGTVLVAAKVAGDYQTYSEVNMDGVASVTTDSGLTFKTQISINAGQGYDLADDDGFDTAAANGRNGGSVGLDYVSIGGAFGTITIDEGDIAHLVDADDNVSGDISYKGTFGDVTVQAVFDQAKDTNAVAVAADRINGVAGNQGAGDTGNGVDVAWSAAVSGAIQGVSYRYATDEEGGYAGSLGYTMSGVTVGLSTKLEAWEKDLNKPVHNGVSVAYAVEGLSINGAWDSVKDGNQTSWGVGYTGGDATVGFNTNEKNEWTATASLALGAGASLNAGVNYTDDAQVGVSFSF